MLNGDVTLPGFGSVPKKGVLGGILIAGGATAYLYIKHRNSAAAAPANAASYAYGYGAAGYGYGVAGYGYGAALGASGSLYGYGGFGYGAYGYGGYTGVGVATPPVSSIPPTSNAVWAQEAESYLSTQGYDPLTVAAALGKYLTGATLSSEQAGIVQAAIAFENYPPVAGATGYPPSIHSATPGGQSPPKTPKPGSGKGKETGKRHIASGVTSLTSWAKTNKTSTGEVSDETTKNYQSGYMSQSNWERFQAYTRKGYNSKMPPGLIFFSSK